MSLFHFGSSRKLAAVGIVLVALTLAPGALFAEPAVRPTGFGLEQLRAWIAGWIVEIGNGAASDGTTVISSPGKCDADPDGSPCASTATPVPVPSGNPSERRPRFSVCSFIDGFGCNAPPER